MTDAERVAQAKTVIHRIRTGPWAELRQALAEAAQYVDDTAPKKGSMH